MALIAKQFFSRNSFAARMAKYFFNIAISVVMIFLILAIIAWGFRFVGISWETLEKAKHFVQTTQPTPQPAPQLQPVKTDSTLKEKPTPLEKNFKQVVSIKKNIETQNKILKDQIEDLKRQKKVDTVVIFQKPVQETGFWDGIKEELSSWSETFISR